MRHFHIAIVLALASMACLLASCNLTPEERQQLVAGGVGTVHAIDSNGDGVLTREEARAAPGNVNVWLQALNMVGVLLGGAGGAAGIRANSKAKEAEAKAAAVEKENARLRQEVDEQWDKTHKPIVS